MRGALKAVPYGEAIVAERRHSRMERNFSDLSHPIQPRRLFGEEFEKLPKNVRRKIAFETNIIYGKAGEKVAVKLAEKVDPDVRAPENVTMHAGFPGPNRRREFDFAKRDLAQVILDDLKEGYTKFTQIAASERGPGVHHEVKTGAGVKTREQAEADEWLSIHGSEAVESKVHKIRDVRVLPEEIPISFVIEDAEQRFAGLVRKGHIDGATASTLLNALRNRQRSGVKTVRREDYVGLVARLWAASLRVGDAITNER